MSFVYHPNRSRICWYWGESNQKHIPALCVALSPLFCKDPLSIDFNMVILQGFHSSRKYSHYLLVHSAATAHNTVQSIRNRCLNKPIVIDTVLRLKKEQPFSLALVLCSPSLNNSQTFLISPCSWTSWLEDSTLRCSMWGIRSHRAKNGARVIASRLACNQGL